MTDAEILQVNAHISTEEVLRDIEETEREIIIMGQEADHLEKTPLSLPSARLDHMKAAARRSGIVHRQEFVGKLKSLLAIREANDERQSLLPQL